jgi:hypothetical protein
VLRVKQGGPWDGASDASGGGENMQRAMNALSCFSCERQTLARVDLEHMGEESVAEARSTLPTKVNLIWSRWEQGRRTVTYHRSYGGSIHISADTRGRS